MKCIWFGLSCCALTAMAGWPSRVVAQEQQGSGSTVPLVSTGDSSSAHEVTVNDDSEPQNPRNFDFEGNELGLSLLKNLATDQERIWTSPFRLHWGDADWLLPMAEVTAGFLATDRASVRALPNGPKTLNRSRNFSNYALGAFAGSTGGLYLWGKIARDDHKKETGLLAIESMLDSLAVSSTLQYSLGRERPDQDQERGRFFQEGTSFPSSHSVIAWSVASILSHEYPGPLTDILSYGAAAGISASRVTGKEHFPSDVMVGSAIGWFIGREVYRKHHDPELGGTGWEDLSGGSEAGRNRDSHHMGSPFVPLDSWVYPDLDRLAALGYVATSTEGLKPWTRMECARLTEEANEPLSESASADNEAAELVVELQREFTYELNRLSGGRNMTANLDSIYTRAVSISGPDLADGYHFGQTIAYDFGRPFERGTNLQDGGELSAAAGAVTIDIRAEYQHAPSAPALNTAAREFIGSEDQFPVPPDTSIAAINRPEVLDAYVGANLGNFEIAVGRQSLSWGPGPGGSLIWSDNIEPIGMARLVNPEPFRLPGPLHFLGPARLDQFFGRLGGHQFVRRPFVYGQKISFKPLPALELGFSRTTIIGGQGQGAAPLTPHNFFDSLFGIASIDNSVPGASSSSMDWTFYVPHVKNYLVFYGELYARDNFQPLQNPTRMAFRPGIYIPHFPKLPKLDLHVEATSTESPGLNGDEGHLNYYDFQYREGWTNDGNLIGNTVGRMGEAYQGWLTYCISPRNSLQFTYKNNQVDSAFVPGGGAWQDYGVQHQLYLSSGFYVKSELQYENISHYPILFNGPQKNLAAILEVGFIPKRKE